MNAKRQWDKIFQVLKERNKKILCTNNFIQQNYLKNESKMKTFSGKQGLIIHFYQTYIIGNIKSFRLEASNIRQYSKEEMKNTRNKYVDRQTYRYISYFLMSLKAIIHCVIVIIKYISIISKIIIAQREQMELHWRIFLYFSRIKIVLT